MATRRVKDWTDVFEFDERGWPAVSDRGYLKILLTRGAAMPPMTAAALAASGQFEILDAALKKGCVEGETACAILSSIPRVGDSPAWLDCVDACVRVLSGMNVVGSMQVLVRRGVRAQVLQRVLACEDIVDALRARDPIEIECIYQLAAVGCDAAALRAFDEAVVRRFFKAGDVQGMRESAALKLAAALDDYAGAERAPDRIESLLWLHGLGAVTERARVVLERQAGSGALRGAGSASALHAAGLLSGECLSGCVASASALDRVLSRARRLGYVLDGVADESLRVFRVDGASDHAEAIFQLGVDGLCSGLSVVDDDPDAPSVLHIPIASIKGMVQHHAAKNIFQIDSVLRGATRGSRVAR